MEKEILISNLKQLRGYLQSLIEKKSQLDNIQRKFSSVEKNYIRFLNKKEDADNQTELSKNLAKWATIILLGMSIGADIVALSMGRIIMSLLLSGLYMWILYSPQKTGFMKVLKIFFIVALVGSLILTFEATMRFMNIFIFIIYIISFVVAFYIIKFFEKLYQNYVIKNIEERYNELKIQMVSAYEEYQVAQRVFNEEQYKISQFIQGWYPPNYLDLSVVDKFLEYLLNFKVDNMKEAVRLFDQEQHQLKQINLLKTQNTIAIASGIANFIGQMNIADAIDANSKELKGINQKLQG